MTESTPGAPGGVFISYRREDTAYAAGWLYDRLVENFDGVQVFKDVDSVRPGEDFVQAIMAAVGSCSVLLVLIGRYWLSAVDRNGQRRIDDPSDWVRLEIDAGLTRDVSVIPILCDGAPMARADDLPSSIRGLARRQAVELSPMHFTADIDRLFATLSNAFGWAYTGSRPARPGRSAQVVLTVPIFVVLNPSEGARRLALMTLDDAALVLADAPVSASAEALEVLLSDDERQQLAISLLVHIRKSKAQELIAAIPSGRPWLEQLPDAADAIEHCKPGPGQNLGTSVGPLTRATPSALGTQGYYQSFRNGQIHWTAVSGAQVTIGAIGAYHIAWGGSGGRLGFPLTPEISAAASQYGTPGLYQRFEGLQYYEEDVCRLTDRCGATVYWSEQYGAHGTWGSIGAYYELREKGTQGRLGFPIADEAEVGPSLPEAGGTVGWYQRFEGGAIYYSAKTGVISVYEPIAEYLESRGGVHSSVGFPVSPWMDASDSPYKTPGHCQRFEGVEAYPEDVLQRWPDQEVPVGATIYTSDAYGTYSVGWGNGIYYERRDGSNSWLGFPKSDEVDARASESEPWATIQDFEGGTIFYKEEYGSVGVTRATMECLAGREGLRQQMGFPIKEERSLSPRNADDDERVQFFEHGVVTIRNGVIEAWIRPDDRLALEQLVEDDSLTVSGLVENLPIENYDELTIASIRARLRNLSASQIRALIGHERGHSNRPDVITMFERRIAKIESE
jgi:TIR domain/LGFP repeat